MYPVLDGPLSHSGKTYQTGEMAPLSPEEAVALFAIGIVGELAGDKPDPIVQQEGEPPPVVQQEEETPQEDEPPLMTPQEAAALFATDSLVNLNTASNEELQTLPNIGKGLSARIEKSRPIQNLEGLEELLGLTPAQWSEISSLVTI